MRDQLQGPIDPDSTGPRHVKRPNPATFARVTLPQIAAELGVSERRAQHLVRKYRWIGLAPFDEDRVTTYDAKGLERLKAIRQRPNRAGGNWLDAYLGGQQDG